ncbi:glycosyltransferase family 4 protein [Paenibacillus radicis (ex Xue et al. 2023)]|uniref:Glycosyltransferase family 4 protein n=1 Tax=Paenibacillus radicis (ex Xue et al. 2023) TaxID=2972489 RepID=A0ABT1Y960_9BACL|nr:glycosyltransferase family 4 protein [Paenibacillus radicis (ex Xue et al. 2023)]MCR8629716.1 glycosyltransferase family 4 protein [Paenibacillus radicis (ex Xue et al. 2023)]
MKLPFVAIVTPGSFVIPSAMSSSVELVVEHVAPHLVGEVRPVVFGRTGGRKRPLLETRRGVCYVRVPRPSPQAYIRNVSRKLIQYKRDLKLIQVENRPRFVRYLRRTHPKAKIWLVLHSITFISKRHIKRAELKVCLAAADRIIVNSHFLKEQVIRMVPQAKGKIRVNHLGVDPKKFISRWSEKGAALRQESFKLRGIEGKKVVLYVGRLIGIKGVHHLLQAMPQIITHIPDVMLIVVGSAFYGSDRVTPYVKQLHRIGRKMRDNVRFIPYVPHSEIPEWFRLADVLVVPSHINEAFGLVNVEAMATGVPVVATRAGGMKEIIEHGNTGYLVDASRLQDELALWIINLLTQSGQVELMGAQSELRVQEHFTWEKTAERFLNLYKTES